MTCISNTSLAFNLFKKETETTIGLDINIDAIYRKTLGDDRLHLSHRACGIGSDVCSSTTATVHYKGAIVHPCLADLEEFIVRYPPRPRRIDESAREKKKKKNRFQILPFASVTALDN